MNEAVTVCSEHVPWGRMVRLQPASTDPSLQELCQGLGKASWFPGRLLTLSPGDGTDSFLVVLMKNTLGIPWWSSG